MTGGKLLEIVIDKGLFAIIAILFLYLTTRSLERFKTGQAEILESYRTEQTKTVEAYKAEQTRAIEAYKAEQTRAIAEYQAAQAKANLEFQTRQATALEGLKAELQYKQKLAEERLKAIGIISSAFSELDKLITDVSKTDYQATDGDVKQYGAVIDKIRDAYNTSAAVFSKPFGAFLQQFYLVHLGFRLDRLRTGADYREFFAYLYLRYGRLCEKELGVPADLPAGDFELLPWSVKELAGDAAKVKYLRDNHQAWRRWREQQDKK